MAWQMDGIYCGPPPMPSQLWSAWNLDPVLIAALVAMTVMMRASRPGLAACAVLAIAFVSPLCSLSAALFSARVVHHVLLVAVAGPLLALTLPRLPVVGVAMPFLLATTVLWFWHAPIAYDLALDHKGIYWLMQATLLGTSALFWRAVLDPGTDMVSAVLWTLAAFMAMGLLGALLTFAPTPLYAVHILAPLEWGISPINDQRLGGLLMWVPAGLPYFVVIGIVARRGWSKVEAGVA